MCCLISLHISICCLLSLPFWPPFFIHFFLPADLLSNILRVISVSTSSLIVLSPFRHPFGLKALSFLPSFHFYSDFLYPPSPLNPLLFTTINNMRLPLALESFCSHGSPAGCEPWPQPEGFKFLLREQRRFKLTTVSSGFCAKINHVICQIFWAALYLLIVVFFPSFPALGKGFEGVRIASYLISPLLPCSHILAGLRKKRQSGTILIIPTF